MTQKPLDLSFITPEWLERHGDGPDVIGPSSDLPGDSLGDRMKRYERSSEAMLPHRIPVIIRLDGRAFHTMTKRVFGKGWTHAFFDAMMSTAEEVQSHIQGCQFAYFQSDEISLLLTDYQTIKTQGWFGYDLQKMVSISASVAAVEFSRFSDTAVEFDSRAFSVPQDDVVNYFIWRQQDATRNAIQMAAQELYSHTELHKKNFSDLNELLFQKGVNFSDLPTHRKRGACLVNGELDMEIPIFTQDRQYIEKWVNVRED